MAYSQGGRKTIATPHSWSILGAEIGFEGLQEYVREADAEYVDGIAYRDVEELLGV